MKSSVQILYVIALVVCISCKEPATQTINFRNSYSIKGDTAKMNLDSASSLFITNSYIIATRPTNDHFLKVYDAKNFEYLGMLAKKGSGENEYPTMAMVDQYEPCGDDDCLWTHDLNKGELMKINVTQSLKDQTTVVSEKIMTRGESRFYTAFYIDSSRIVGRSTNSTPQMNRLQTYNPTSDQILKTVSLFPVVDARKGDLRDVLNHNMLYLSSIGLKSDKTKVASAMCSFDRIDIFDIDGELERSVFNGAEIPESVNEYLDDNSYENLNLYHNGIFTSNEYIYTLYFGQPFSDFGRKAIPTQIRIFNWNGDALCKIDIEDYILSFTVDEKNGLLYGVDNLNQKIIKYNVKQVLNEL